MAANPHEQDPTPTPPPLIDAAPWLDEPEPEVETEDR